MAEKVGGSASLLNYLWTLWTLWTNVPSVYFFRKVSIFSGKVARGIVVVKIILRILINFVPAFAYIKNCLYLCRRKQYHEATFHNRIGSLTPAIFLQIESRHRQLLKDHGKVHILHNRRLNTSSWRRRHSSFPKRLTTISLPIAHPAV